MPCSSSPKERLKRQTRTHGMQRGGRRFHFFGLSWPVLKHQFSFLFEPTLGFSVSSLMARLLRCLKQGRNLPYRDFRWQRLNHTISIVVTRVAFCPHRKQ